MLVLTGMDYGKKDTLFEQERDHQRNSRGSRLFVVKTMMVEQEEPLNMNLLFLQTMKRRCQLLAIFKEVRLELYRGEAETGPAVLKEIGETLRTILDLVKATLEVLQQRNQSERKDL